MWLFLSRELTCLMTGIYCLSEVICTVSEEGVCLNTRNQIFSTPFDSGTFRQILPPEYAFQFIQLMQYCKE
jgi:hypothetical protein